MAATYEIIAAQLLRINTRNHAAWNDWGAGLCNEALTLPNDVAEPMLADAARKFAVACDLSPRNVLYWSNFGIALYQQGLRSPDASALPLFREAGEAHERAVRLSPRRYNSWNEAGICLLEQAKRTERDRCEPLYHAAYVRFAVATDLQPQTVLAWSNWGVALLNHAGRVSNADSPRLAMEAATKFERVAHLIPDNSEPFNNRAAALMDVVKYVPSALGVDAWLADAHAALTVAISLSPDTVLYWRNRAWVLMLQARRLPMDKRDAILADADAQCAIAHRLAPEDYVPLMYWGNACGERARYAEDAAIAVAHAQEAVAKFEAALKIEPNDAQTWVNWGIVLNGRAYDEPERRAELFVEANEKFTVAERFDVGNAHLLASWAYTNVGSSRLQTGEDAERLLAQAEERATEALRCQPGSPDAHVVLSEVCIRRADRDPDRRAALFAEATSHANRADALRPGVAAYNRACIAALTGDEAGCERYLREAVAGNRVSNRRRVRADEDLASVRNAPWFHELFGTD
ncbi:MAG: hypothetical protein H7Y38_19640 [Armatimonadetes bacterium]|nr:hypothetical protein [Armatimonadota bacterium]